jgi:hypothetical protein
MKSYISALLISISFISENVWSQSGTSQVGNLIPKSFIEFSGGASIPMGNFASIAASGPISGSYTTTSGFAKTGTHFAIDGAFFFSPHIGIGGSLSTASFSIDTKTIAAGYLENYDCDSASAKARSYNTINLLVGPYFSFPFGKVTMDLRVLGGISRTQTPDIIGTVINQYSGPTEGSVSTFVQTSGLANAFAFQAGLGIRYKISGHFILSLRGDYFYSKPELSFDNINRSNTGRILTSYNQPISGFNTTFGVGYQF